MLKRSAPALSRHFLTAVLIFVLALYVLWMLSLPAWPSQDGPVHLYYTRVLDALFSNAPSPFHAHFFIKHLVPPYAVYYYSLLLLSHVMPLLAADRVVICGYLISFVLGFRYAARAIGPNAPVTSLLASLLVLNWGLGMGFANYCLSISFALWAIGIWLRLGSGLQLGKRLAFFALMAVMTLTHPVPLLLVLGFGCLDLVCRYFAARRAQRAMPRREIVYGLLTLAGGSLCLLYVKSFTVAHPLAQRTQVQGNFAENVIRRIRDVIVMKNVELLYGHWWKIEVYRGCLGLILVAAMVFAVQQWRRNRAADTWAAGDSMLVYAVCIAVLLPLLPSDLSGAYYFFERLNVLLWITMLLAASMWRPMERVRASGTPVYQTDLRRTGHTELYAAAFTIVGTLLLLNVANTTLRPLADHDYRLAHTDVPMRGQFVVVLDGGQERRYTRAGPPWDPYFWDTVGVLRRNDAIMVNAPWLDSPIIPLAETDAEPGNRLPPTLANSPFVLGNRLSDTPALRSDILARTAIALFSPVGSAGNSAVPAMLGSGWACNMVHGEGYRLCTREQPVVARLGSLSHAPVGASLAIR